MTKEYFALIFAIFAGLISVAIRQHYFQDTDLPTSNECFSKFSESLNRSSFQDLHSLQTECFFRSNYADARALFLDSAKSAGATLTTMPVIGSFVTDVAIFRGDPQKFLVHVSGTHGVEGYAGSSAQSAILKYLSLHGDFNDSGLKRTRLPTLVFVHALNPFGFSNNRRVNEDNIDLNRNFLKKSKFVEVTARDPNFAGYVDVDYALNPVTQPTTNILLNDIHGLLLTASAVIKFGLSKIKRALVSGNYYKQTGLGYGGKALSQSAKNLIELVESLQIPSTGEHVTLIDVHTGLGPSGVDTLAQLAGDPLTSPDLELIFPTEYSRDKPKSGVITGGIKESTANTKSGAGAMAGYDLTVGTISEDFCRQSLAPRLDEKHRICVTQEFGTVDMITVGKTLSDENYAYHHGSDSEKIVYGRRLKNSFYVNTLEWKKNVARRGLTVFLQALDHLTSKK